MQKIIHIRSHFGEVVGLYIEAQTCLTALCFQAQENRREREGVHPVKMNSFGEWKPVVAMVVVNFALAIVNLLLKKVLNEGTNQLIIVTYRQSISAIFLGPIAYFWNRYSFLNFSSKDCSHQFTFLVLLNRFNKGTKILGFLAGKADLNLQLVFYANFSLVLWSG